MHFIKSSKHLVGGTYLLKKSGETLLFDGVIKTKTFFGGWGHETLGGTMDLALSFLTKAAIKLTVMTKYTTGPFYHVKIMCHKTRLDQNSLDLPLYLPSV